MSTRGSLGLMLQKNLKIKLHHENVFDQEDDGWLVAFGGVSANIKHAKGMTNIARLLENMGKAYTADEFLVECGEVAVADNKNYDPEEINQTREANYAWQTEDVNNRIDSKYVKSIKRCVEKLYKDLEIAEEFGDTAKMETIQKEIDDIKKHHSKDVRPNGKSKKFPTKHSNKVDSIRRNISCAIKNITKRHPTLGEHLRKSIRFGSIVLYKPVPEIKWKVSIR